MQPHRQQPTRLPVLGILQARTLEWVAIAFSSAWKWSLSVVSNPQRPHGLKPSRLLRPWDFPGKRTGVGCHCLLYSSAISWLGKQYTWKNTTTRFNGWNHKLKKSKEGVREGGSPTDLEVEMRASGETVADNNLPLHCFPSGKKKVLGSKVDLEKPSSW